MDKALNFIEKENTEYSKVACFFKGLWELWFSSGEHSENVKQVFHNIKNRRNLIKQNNQELNESGK